jgi:hypothetical protein
MPNIDELIRDHVTLSIRCLDRVHLHACMPKLQTSGGLCYLLRDHLGHPTISDQLGPGGRPGVLRSLDRAAAGAAHGRRSRPWHPSARPPASGG